jgi:hypothetical protein
MKKTPDNTFQPGNTFGRGRPQGSRNKATIALQEMLDGHGESITRKCALLVLLCYKRRAQQKGQQGSCWMRTLAILMRRVAMDCGLCRSARTRRAAGLEVGRNLRGA